MSLSNKVILSPNFFNFDSENIKKNKDFNEDKEEEEIYLGLCLQNKLFGASFYSVNTNIVYLVPDYELDEKYEVLINLIVEVRPKLFITTKHVYEIIKNIFCDEDAQNCVLSEDAFAFVSTNDISYNLSLRRVCELSLPSTKSMTEQEKGLFIRSLVPTQAYNMIRSCGGLLKFIEKNRIGIELESEISSIPVLDIQIYTLENTMYIDDNSLRALNIFNKVSHPSGFKQGMKSDVREGPSVFNLLNNCHSKLASDRLRCWIRRPLTDINTLSKRLDAVDFFQSSQNNDLLLNLQKRLKVIGNIKQILNRMKQSSALIGDWNVFYQTIGSFISVSELMSQIKKPLHIASQIKIKFTDELFLIVSWMQNIIDFSAIEKQKKFVVKEGIDPNLDEKKSKYFCLPDLLTSLAEEELKSFNENIQICGFVYLPQLGYLLTIPINTEQTTNNSHLFADMEYIFSMKGAAYYKNKTARKLDKEFGDVLYEIKDMETTIMYHLQESILEHTHMLLNCLDIVTELDCLISLSAAARQMNGSRPRFSKDGNIEIHNGRHPLQELYSNPFIANSITSNTSCGKVTIITGSNGSGKSVYLKQVGILIILAQIGSFVPAEKMILTPQSAILTRLKSLECSLSGMSTFMVDLNQLSLCCKKSSSKSLILIDEFGKGVETKSGIALLAAFLRSMLSRESECPHIFVVTHLHRLYSLIEDYTNVQYKNFNVMEDNNGHLIYLYQLVDGKIDCSHAHQAARLVNIPDNILTRSKEISTAFVNGKALTKVTKDINKKDLENSVKMLNHFVGVDLDFGNIKDKLNKDLSKI